MRTHLPTQRGVAVRIRRIGLAVGLLGTAVAGSTFVSSSPAAAVEDGDFIFGDQWFYEGTTNFGDLPDCGADNIDGHDDGATAHWEVLSTIADGDEIEPGDEFVIRADVSGNEQSTGDNGPDPLGLHILYNGPVEVVSLVPAFEPGPGEVVHGGGGSVGPIGPVNATEFRWDVNSNPGVFEATDGAHVRMDITFRATAEGVINILDFNVNGYDGTPQAGNFSCGVDLDWQFLVDDVDLPTSGPDAAKVDASYSGASIEDAAGGAHGVNIDVLANDNDPEVPGGPGNPAEVRITDWSQSNLGGTVSCGTLAEQSTNTFSQMSDGPCVYTPPADTNPGQNDFFVYRLRSVSGKERLVQVNIDLRDDRAPVNGDYTGQGGFNVGDDEPAAFALQPHDFENDPVVCIADPVASTHAAVGADCVVTWTASATNGTESFQYIACGQHPSLVNGQLGTGVTRLANYATPGDFNGTTMRRCASFSVDVNVFDDDGAFFALPPRGVPDADVVDAGYAGDGIGAYTVEIPVRMNDTDANGTAPSDPAFGGSIAILDGPDPSEGTATVNADREIVFTPADGFEGPVELTYNVGEDPAQQNPDYDGLPFAGVGRVSILVIGNPAPVAVDDAVLTNSVDDVVDLDVGANDADPEGEALECTPGALVAAPAGIVQSASIDAGCLVDVVPVEGADGAATLTYEVCDTHVLADPAFPAAAYGDDGRDPLDDAPRCDEADVVVTVASDAEVLGGDQDNPDPDPVCANDAAATPAGVAVTIPVLANDSDLVLGGTPGTLEVDSAGSGDTEEVTAQGGAVAVAVDGTTVRYTPRAGFTGVDTFEYAALDSVGQVCTAVVRVTVTAVGTTPTSTGVGSGTLPRTGAGDGVGQFQVGLGLAIAGFGMVLLGRRRPEGGAAA